MSVVAPRPAESDDSSWDSYTEQAPSGDFERVPPQDLAAEQSVLGGMLLTKSAIGDVSDSGLKAADYYRPAHELVHLAILDLYAAGEPADPITVADELTKRGEITRVGGPSYLHTLVNSVPTAANAAYYAEIVREKAVLRRLVEAGTRIAGMGYAAEGDVNEIVNAAGAEIYAITEQRSKGTEQPLGEGLDETLDWMEARGKRKKGEISGIPTGYADLDALTDGLQPGQLIVIAGRPAMGKTTVAMDIARECSIRRGLPSMFFSLEMPRRELHMRILSAEGTIALHHMRTGNMTEEDWQRVSNCTPRISAAPMVVDDDASLTMMDISTKARRQAMTPQGLGLIVIDYLQLVEFGAGRYENRQQEVTKISRAAKKLGKELGVPVIAVAQLNRGPELRTDKKPMVSDLRESGAIEQDADMVILIHREDAYEKESPRAGEADLIVGKHRNGPTATITVAFQGHYSRFVDMTKDVT
ncbi:replicative DNA helicase [Kitasatospora sp. NPDC002965]|uniref:replicative DNA helicase n=1 Tax=Kitasatospora sp. NPDC002965 TaxID=3154775 RepID=UPI0033B0455E